MSCHSKLWWQVQVFILKRHPSILFSILPTPKILCSLLLHGELPSPAEIRALSFEASRHTTASVSQIRVLTTCFNTCCNHRLLSHKIWLVHFIFLGQCFLIWLPTFFPSVLNSVLQMCVADITYWVLASPEHEFRVKHLICSIFKHESKISVPLFGYEGSDYRQNPAAAL